MPENYSKAMQEHCLLEIARLANQEFFKADELILEDLSKRLAECADSPEHATEMITAWKRSTRKMLHESDIPELADLTANRGTLPAGCLKCKGTDFVVVEKNGYTGAGRCGCARGRILLKLDQERRAQQTRRDCEPKVNEPEAKPDKFNDVSEADFSGSPWKN